MAWLVTGGAGYIGSHVVRALAAAGTGAVVLDDLSSGDRSFVPDGVPLVVGSVLDREAVREALDGAAGTVEGVVHLAAFKYAGISVDRPLHTYEQNLLGTQRLLEGVVAAGVPRVVLSSTAAVYGTPSGDVVDESAPTRPESPYGESKLAAEWLLRAVERTGALRAVSLRYFNVVGSGDPAVVDKSPHALLPILLQAVLEGRRPAVFGTDYPTRDGSCVRDYVHVADIADAHVAAVRALAEGRALEPVYNLGTGSGATVLEVVDAVRRLTGSDTEPELADRRPGDPVSVVASNALAQRDLGWTPRHDLDAVVASAWEAVRRTAGG